MNDEHLDQLIEAHLSGVLGAEQQQELEFRLLHSASDRERFWHLAETHALLHEACQQGLGRGLSLPETKKSGYRFTWGPLTAAAAGLVIGLFSATMVFAYVGPKSPAPFQKHLPVVDPGFESGTPIPAAGIPDRAGEWSGDFVRIVPAEYGILPQQGQQMLRFLRADHDLSPTDELSYVSETSQIIDLRPLRPELSGTESLVELSASFNAIPQPRFPQYEFTVKAAAYRGDISTAPQVWEDREASVSRAHRFVVADLDKTTWQKVTVPLMVPQDADFIIINCSVVYKGPQEKGQAAQFPGHYVDQVDLRLGPARFWNPQK